MVVNRLNTDLTPHDEYDSMMKVNYTMGLWFAIALMFLFWGFVCYEAGRDDKERQMEVNVYNQE